MFQGQVVVEHVPFELDIALALGIGDLDIPVPLEIQSVLAVFLARLLHLGHDGQCPPAYKLLLAAL